MGKKSTKKPAKKPAKKENKLFPGRPNYTGPQKGIFALLHHRILFEQCGLTCYANVQERVKYVKTNKLGTEVAVRLHNMVCLNDLPLAKLVHSLEVATRKASKANVHYRLRRKVEEVLNAIKRSDDARAIVLRYLDQVNPGHDWDEKHRVLKGTEGTP